MNMNKKGFVNIVLVIIIVVIIGAVGYFALIEKPTDQPTVSNQPSPSKQNMPTNQTQTNTPQSESMSPIITDIKPSSVRVGSEVVITGKNFFQNRSSVFLTPIDRSAFGDYYNNLVSHTPLPFNSDTLIKFIISPKNFEYGDCNASKYKNCDISGRYSELIRIPDGVYELSVVNVGCIGNTCISNKIKLTVTN